MLCPLCQSETTFAFEAKGFPINDCTACDHRFTAAAADEAHVAEVYADSYFSGGGAGYANYLQEAEMLAARGQTYARIIEKFSDKKGRMLDVGAAAGFLMKGFAAAGWHAAGIEPNEKMANFGRERLNLDVRQGAFESYSTTEKFDLVSMIQVAAHFYDPRRAFEKAHELLDENGLLLIETWNRDSISARVFGQNWHEYSPPSVLQFFSEKGVTKFLGEIGFECLGRGRPSKKISGAHARSLLRYRLGDSFLLKLIPEKIKFPYPSEDLFWALYRKK